MATNTTNISESFGSRIVKFTVSEASVRNKLPLHWSKHNRNSKQFSFLVLKDGDVSNRPKKMSKLSKGEEKQIFCWSVLKLQLITPWLRRKKIHEHQILTPIKLGKSQLLLPSLIGRFSCDSHSFESWVKRLNIKFHLQWLLQQLVGNEKY